MSIFFSSGTPKEYHALHDARLEARGPQGQEPPSGTGEASANLQQMNDRSAIDFFCNSYFGSHLRFFS